MTHSEFIKGYKSGKLLVYIDKSKAGDFVLSDPADKHNKPAHYFWVWIGFILTLPLPIILIFINWKYSILSFIFGSMVSSAARKSSQQFVLQNMIEDESFWRYVLLHRGAIVRDKDNNVFMPAL